ncbi:hypothetical protein J6590_050762 [Homalodisca vitripennis]|nr:hypothetical protein J6590_050762 [Homalodisca vitripennis]
MIHLFVIIGVVRALHLGIIIMGVKILQLFTLIIMLLCSNMHLQGCYRSGKSGKKTGLEIREKSGNPVSSKGKVREFRRWSGKNIKSLYTNKLTAAAPSPSLQTTRRMKQKPWGLCRKKSGKNEKFGLEIRENKTCSKIVEDQKKKYNKLSPLASMTSSTTFLGRL